MTKLTLTDGFARYGATLRNVQWAVSDIAGGHLVVSLWHHLFGKPEEGVMAYRDRLSRWSGADWVRVQTVSGDRLAVTAVWADTTLIGFESPQGAGRKNGALEISGGFGSPRIE